MTKVKKFDKECYSIGGSKMEPGLFVTVNQCELSIGDILALEDYGNVVVEEVNKYCQHDCSIARVTEAVASSSWAQSLIGAFVIWLFIFIRY